MNDAKMMFVSRDEILELLKKAFDEGWGGYQDLRDATAEGLLEELVESRKKKAESARSIPLSIRLDPVDFAPSPESSFVPGDSSPSISSGYQGHGNIYARGSTYAQGQFDFATTAHVVVNDPGITITSDAVQVISDSDWHGSTTILSH